MEGTMGESRSKHRLNSHPTIHCPTSEGVSEMSERANEWARQSARAKRASKVSGAEQANKWVVRANKQTDERVAQYFILYFWSLWPKVEEKGGEVGIRRGIEERKTN